jgi:hypothetical protein
MNAKYEAWDESIMEVEDYQVERALTNAALDAIHRARRFGTNFIIEQNGVTCALKPNETGPQEKLLLETLARLNKKIAEMEAQNPNALTLNDKPKP